MAAKPKRGVRRQKKTAQTPRQRILPPHTDHLGDRYFRISIALAFFLSFIIYLLTLAPTVTFEDSGELISAVHLTGVPHQPGYPLFVLLGKLFSWLPVGNVAFRLNLMSAFFSAVGCALLTWFAILLIEDIFFGSKSWSDLKDRVRGIHYSAGLSAGLFLAVSFENWEQSIITEVYGLNTMLVALLLLLAMLWRRQSDPASRRRYFVWVCVVFGLGLSNHHSMLVLIPVFALYALLVDRRFFASWKNLAAGVGALVAGLLPYLYLPLASLANPVLDWGNPENLTNFFRTISRHQYVMGNTQTVSGYMAQLGSLGDLMVAQWIPVCLVLAIVALGVLYRRNRLYFVFSVVFLLFTGPITTFLTNFDLSGPAPVAAENRALSSVFYIPLYLYLSVLFGIGLFWVAGFFRRFGSSRMAGPALIVVLPLVLGFPNFSAVDMDDYYLTEDYVDNLFGVVQPNGVVIAHWDPFYFPLNYYQWVEKRRTDVVALDQQLLRRSWYIDMMRRNEPEFMALAGAEVDAFLAAVKPFEEGDPYDGDFIQAKYEGMIRALVDRAYESGRPVYLTFPADESTHPGYRSESVVAAWRLHKSVVQPSSVNLDDLRFRGLQGKTNSRDRWRDVFRLYYGQHFLERAALEEQAGHFDVSLRLYRWAADFFRGDPRLTPKINSAIDRLSGLLGPSKP